MANWDACNWCSVAERKTKAKPKAAGSGTGGRKGRRSALYTGATVSRLNADWVFGPVSGDQEVRRSLRRLRDRSRDLQRNSPTIRWYLRLLQSNVIGAKGPRLAFQSRLGGSGELDKRTNDLLAESFADWARCATADGRLSLLRFALKAVRALAVDGEVFVRRVVGYPHNRFRFALQLLEPDLLDEEYNLDPPPGRGNRVRLGVEVDEWDFPVAYHFWNGYPDDGGRRERVRILASEVRHLFEHERASQTRGIPWAASILANLKMTDGYTEAEVVASRASAQKIGVLKYDDPSSFTPRDPEADGPIQLDASSGELWEAPPGMSLQSWDPQHPNAAFAEFMKAMKREAASGLGLFANTLANSAEAISWSSMRSFLQIERDCWRLVQASVCDPSGLLPWIVEGWLETAALVGAVALPSRDWRPYARHQWKPRGWEWVDPENQAKAAETRLRDGLASPQMILDDQGIDLEDVLEERQEFRRLATAYGEDPDQIMAAWLGQGGTSSSSGSTLSATGPQNGGQGEEDAPEDDGE